MNTKKMRAVGAPLERQIEAKMTRIVRVDPLVGHDNRKELKWQ